MILLPEQGSGYAGVIGTRKTITHAGTAHVKSAWVEVTASLPADAIGLILFWESCGNRTAMLDLGIGAAGSEVVVVANLYNDHPSTYGEERNYPILLPIAIPAGTRIAVRAQASATTGNQILTVVGIYGGMDIPTGMGGVDTYGAETADTSGIALDPGAVADTKGAWVEISSATTKDIKCLLLCVGGSNIATRADSSWKVDIGIGSAGSEVVLIDDLHVQAFNSVYNFLTNTVQGPFQVGIPSGTRLAARASCDITTASAREIDIVLYGFH